MIMIKGNEHLEERVPLYKPKESVILTLEQIKKVAQWCGFTDIRVFVGRLGWEGSSPDGKFKVIELDLNNFWRYVLPKIKLESRNWKSILHDWLDNCAGDAKDVERLYRLCYNTYIGSSLYNEKTNCLEQREEDAPRMGASEGT